MRLAIGLVHFPVALAGSNVVTRFGGSGAVQQAAAFLLLALAFVTLVVVGGWWAARVFSSRVPPWPRSRPGAKGGASLAFVAASVVVVALIQSAPLTALLFAAGTVVVLVLLWVREAQLDQRFEQAGHEVMVLAGYR